MGIPLWCLLFFAAWTVVIVVAGVAPFRVVKVLSGKAKPHEFPADKPHGSDLYRRIIRAHMNCVENLPVFGAVVLVAAVTQLSSPTFDTLAVVYLAARVCQTIAHISSGRSLAIHIRFTFFAVQLISVVWMGVLVCLSACAP